MTQRRRPPDLGSAAVQRPRAASEPATQARPPVAGSDNNEDPVTPTIDVSALIASLATRTPGRAEATVQADIRTLLLAAPLNLTEHGVEAINLETPAGERRRIDIEAGYTVIEVKRDLRVGNVRSEAVDQLAGYVKQRTSTLGQRYVGVLTDGAEWRLYHLAPSGGLEQVGETVQVSPQSPTSTASSRQPIGGKGRIDGRRPSTLCAAARLHGVKGTLRAPLRSTSSLGLRRP